MHLDMQYNPAIQYIGLSFHALAHTEKATFANNLYAMGKEKAAVISSFEFSKNGVIILES